MSDSHEIIEAPPVQMDQRPDDETLHPLIKMLGPEATIEDLQKMVALQERHEERLAKKAFDRDMVALQAEMPRVLQRDKLVEFSSKKGRVSYRHTTLAAAMDQLSETISKHHFSINWHPTVRDRVVEVTCRLTHCDGHYQETMIPSPPDNNTLRSTAQNIASTITLLQRYTLLSLLGVATGDMVEPRSTVDDGDRVDELRNKAAVVSLRRLGIEVAEAEEVLQANWRKWTVGQLSELTTWSRNHKGPEE